MSQNVLFVDDEESLTHVVSTLLERQGFRVHAAVDPRDALSAFASRPGHFDALVTDLMMPGMSGLYLSAAVRSLRPGLPIVLCSGAITPAHREAAASLGIREVLEKPYSAEGLVRILRSM